MTLVSAIAAHLNVRTEVDRQVPEMKQDIAPDAVLDQIEASKKRNHSGSGESRSD